MQIGDVFRYGRPYDPGEPIIDGLPNYFHVTYSEGERLALLDRGINPIAKIEAQGISRCPAILISSSPHKIGAQETPWQDFFDPDNGHIRYYGDNKRPCADPALSPGNKALLETYLLHKAPTSEDRKHAVPIIFFNRVKHEGRAKGHVQFQGYGIVERVERVTQYVCEAYFPNYVFDFVVFSLREETELFDWSWITARRDSLLDVDATLRSAPASWKMWIREGESVINKCRRRVSRLRTVKADVQRPSPGSREQAVLKEICSFYQDRKARFEALAALVASRIIDSTGTKYTFGWITPPSSDGGSDFIGRLDIGYGFSRTKLIVLGQAKCEAPDRPTSGRDIARTVARLKRGWIGVYVTTAYFSEAVQREIIEDEYPIMCINGLQLAREVFALAFEEGFNDISAYLDSVDGSYDQLIQVRRPEELLLAP